MTPETNPGEYFVSPVCVAFSSLPSAMFLMDNTVAQKNHVQRCDNHLGDQLIQSLRKKKQLVRTQIVLFSLKCLSGHGTQHQFKHLPNHAAISTC